MNSYRLNGKWYRGEHDFVRRVGGASEFRLVRLAPATPAESQEADRKTPAHLTGDIVTWSEGGWTYAELGPQPRQDGVTAWEAHAHHNEVRELAGLPVQPLPDPVRQRLLEQPAIWELAYDALRLVGALVGAGMDRAGAVRKIVADNQPGARGSFPGARTEEGVVALLAP